MDDRIPRGLSPTYWSTWSRPNHRTWIGTAATGANVSELLEEGETWVGGWDSVGLYEGNNKVDGYQVLQVHITTHRILLVPTPDLSMSNYSSLSPNSITTASSSSLQPPALQLSLSNIRQTEFYNGFMRSSAKITLHLGPPNVQSASQSSSHMSSPTFPAQSTPSVSPVNLGTASSSTNGSSSRSGKGVMISGGNAAGESVSNIGGLVNWTCGICGFVNPSGTKCQLCGVGISSVPPSRTGTPISSSLPRSSTLSSSRSTSTIIPITSPPSGHTASTTDNNADLNPDPPHPKTSQADPEGRIACPACTFLNHPSLLSCEICSTPLPTTTVGRKERPVSVGSSMDVGPAGGGNGRGGGGVGKGWDVVRLSFRKGGEKEAYRRLKNVLVQKAWEVKKIQKSEEQLGAGIDGILRSMNLEAQTKDAHMQDAFKDLEVLMVRAGEMVRMAQSLASKLTYQSSEEDASLIRTSLVQLGLPAPALTHDMVKDDRAYHDGLARELGVLLTGTNSAPIGVGNKQQMKEGLMRGINSRGVIGLDEVWGLWMRARGVSLLPPSTLLAVIPYLPTHTSPPIRLLTLPSSLKVLYVPYYAPTNILSRIIALLQPTDRNTSETRIGKKSIREDDIFESRPESASESGTEVEVEEKSLSLTEIAAHEGLAVGLAKEIIEFIEMKSVVGERKYDSVRNGSGGGNDIGDGKGWEMGIVRDEQAGYGSGGVRWYRDLISSWPIDTMRSE